MVHKHECLECQHDLHYCKCCQKVYCCKCGQEWGGYSNYYPYWTTTISTPCDVPYWETTCATHSDGDVVTGVCTHLH